MNVFANLMDSRHEMAVENLIVCENLLLVEESAPLMKNGSGRTMQ